LFRPTSYVYISGTLTFAPGEMIKTVRVPIIDDTVVEATESFFFNLSSPTGGAVIDDGVGKATIIDDDGPPAVAAPGVARVALNVPTPVSGISISENGVISGGAFALTLADDADAPSATAIGLSSPLNGIFTVTLEDLRGLLSATGSGITGSGTTRLTIVGSLSQVNAILATLRDLETIAGSDTITVRAADANGNLRAGNDYGHGQALDFGRLRPRELRHSVAERQRGGRHLGDQRHHGDQQWKLRARHEINARFGRWASGEMV
jgi:hypothetical protein